MISIIFRLHLLALTITLAVSYSTDVGKSNICQNIFTIENQLDGFFTSTSDVNYAFIAANLRQRRWLAVSINGEQVVAITTRRKIKSYKLSLLGENTKELIEKIRANFTRSLTGLDLRNELLTNVVTNQGSPSQYRSAGAVSSFGPLGVASNGSPNLQLSPPVTVSGSYIDLNGVNRYPANGRAYRTAANTSPYINSPLAPAGYKGKRSLSYANGDYYPPFNYYNLYQSALNDTLPGDVTQFDCQGNVLNIYSDTASVKRKPGSSVVYRDHRSFIYSQQNLPNSINTFVLAGEFVIFVYNDNTVLIKSANQLESTELDLVVAVRSQLKDIAKWQNQAAIFMRTQTDDDEEQDDDVDPGTKEVEDDED